MDHSLWEPRLSPIEGTVHDRLVAALSEDIGSGVIASGSQLPAHRELARKLGLSVATVTKAYSTLQRSGLARSEAGRGTFAYRAPAEGEQGVDFSINMPPAGVASDTMRRLGERISCEVGGGIYNRYQPASGTAAQRALLAKWLQENRSIAARPETTLLASSAQHALFTALAAVPAGPVGVEALTYPGGLRIMRQLGRPMVALPLDDEGITPAGLRAVLRSKQRPRVISIVPALQNPTGATMSRARREELAAIIREEELIVVEDDIYASFVPDELPSFAQLAPDNTLHVSSFSKSIAPGLRVGYLSVPEAFVDVCTGWLEATSSMNNPVSGVALEFCAEQDVFAQVRAAMRKEVARRSQLADEILADLLKPCDYPSLHRWMPMQASDARKVVAAAATAGLKLALPDAFMVDAEAEAAGVRICLGNAPAHLLEDALKNLKPILLDASHRSYAATAPI